MRRTISTLICMMVVLALLSPAVHGAQDSSKSYNFQLTVNGDSDAAVSVGDEITIEVKLDRTDEGKSGSYSMYSLQDEIIYDSIFFSMVENSQRVTDGYNFNVVTMDDGIRKRVILSRISYSPVGIETPDSEDIISFKLKALSPKENTPIISKDYKVNSKTASTYRTTANDVSVTILGVPETYTVTFDSKGGSAIPAQILNKGDKILKPADPVREGYTFGGWFGDEELNDPWNFDSDRVMGNVKLIAKWTSSGSGGLPGGGGGIPGGGETPVEGEVPVDESDDQISPSQSYVDVDQSLWYTEAINFVIENKLFFGTSETTFEPDSPMSRTMLVTVLWRLEGKPTSSSPVGFGDVADGTWYTDAVNWANANKIVEGYGNGLFGSNDNVTREQMASILYRYAQNKGYDVSKTTALSEYTDASDISSYAQTSMKWANAEGYITGRTTTTLVHAGSATRSEVAAILMRFIINTKN